MAEQEPVVSGLEAFFDQSELLGIAAGIDEASRAVDTSQGMVVVRELMQTDAEERARQALDASLAATDATRRAQRNMEAKINGFRIVMRGVAEQIADRPSDKDTGDLARVVYCNVFDAYQLAKDGDPNRYAEVAQNNLAALTTIQKAIKNGTPLLFTGSYSTQAGVASKKSFKINPPELDTKSSASRPILLCGSVDLVIPEAATVEDEPLPKLPAVIRDRMAIQLYGSDYPLQVVAASTVAGSGPLFIGLEAIHNHLESVPDDKRMIAALALQATGVEIDLPFSSPFKATTEHQLFVSLAEAALNPPEDYKEDDTTKWHFGDLNVLGLQALVHVLRLDKQYVHETVTSLLSNMKDAAPPEADILLRHMEAGRRLSAIVRQLYTVS